MGMSNRLNEHWERYKKDGNQQAKEALIIGYVELVKIIAGRLYTSFQANVDFEDLVSYGIVGLIDAIEKFDISKSVKFDTYANIRIRGAIVDQIRALDWIPRSTRQKFRQLETAMNRLRPVYGDDIPDELLAKEMHMSLHEFTKFMGESSMLSIVSLDEKISESPNFNVRSKNKESDPQANLFDKETKKILKERIETLPEREKTIISLYYYSGLTYKEIARVLDISESRISQLHSKAIVRLRAVVDDLY